MNMSQYKIVYKANDSVVDVKLVAEPLKKMGYKPYAGSDWSIAMLKLGPSYLGDVPAGQPRLDR